MPDQPVADSPAAAVDDVHDALWQSGLVEQLDEALAEQGRVGRRLEDGGVAADERRHELPRRNRNGEVPRRDRADDPDRHADAHVELVGELRRRRRAEQPPALTGHVEADVDSRLDVAARLGDDLAHLARHQLRDVFLLVDQELPEAVEDLAALRRGHEPPLLERRLRRLDGAIDVLGARLRECPDQLAGRRTVALEGLSARRVDPLAADVVAKGLRRGSHGGDSTSRPAAALVEGASPLRLAVTLNFRAIDADISAVAAAPLRGRLLGEVLVEQGVLTPEELEEALAIQARDGGLLGEIIVACGYACRPTITNALAEQRGMVLQPQAGFGSGLRGKIQRRHAERRQIQIPDADDDGNLLEDEAAENCGELPYPEFLAADVHRDPGANGAGAMREEHDAALVELEFESTAARLAELEVTLTERDADVQRLLTAGASAEAKLAQLRATIEEG